MGEKWRIGAELKSLDSINEMVVTFTGSRGRTKCPTGVKNWYSAQNTGNGFHQKSKSEIQVTCGGFWSEWSSCDRKKCGDRRGQKRFILLLRSHYAKLTLKIIFVAYKECNGSLGLLGRVGCRRQIIMVIK